MRFSTKDLVGLVLVTGTVGVLVAHVGPDGHAAKHQGPIADGGGSVTMVTPEQVVAFVDVNVLPMDSDQVLRRQIVVVEGGFIRRIGPVGVIEPPMGARVVRGDGTRYLIPGMTDAHVHLPDGAESWLPLFVANGVTTVFNLRGEERHLDLRERIRAGEVLGPTLYTSGPFTSEPGIRSPEDAKRAVRRQAERGYDFVKIHGDLSAEAFRALADASREQGIALVGHAPRNLPFAAVIENRQANVAHAEELIYTAFPTLDPAELGAVAASMAEAGTWLTPTLATFGNIMSQWGTTDGLEAGLLTDAARFVPQDVREDWRRKNPYVTRDPKEQTRIAAMHEFQHPLIRAMRDAGVPILTGTDTPLPVMAPGFSLLEELQALREAGLSDFEVLQAATRNAGRFVQEHVDEDALFGTVRVGARADLIMLDGNPLEDLEALRRPDGVMVRGRWFDRGALDRMLEGAAGGR